jgi:hypothetical protein
LICQVNGHFIRCLDSKKVKLSKGRLLIAKERESFLKPNILLKTMIGLIFNHPSRRKR